jgi:hypothetical protein
MARTMQTERKSTGGKAPRRQLATKSARMDQRTRERKDSAVPPTSEKVHPVRFAIGHQPVTKRASVMPNVRESTGGRSNRYCFTYRWSDNGVQQLTEHAKKRLEIKDYISEDESIDDAHEVFTSDFQTDLDTAMCIIYTYNAIISKSPNANVLQSSVNAKVPGITKLLNAIPANIVRKLELK